MLFTNTIPSGAPVAIAATRDAPRASFDDLGLIEPLRRAVRGENYATPTEIQAQAIPSLLAGRDLLGCAQTGTGKTAAFALPILQRLTERRRPVGSRGVRALILTPTRELAAQIGDSFRAYGRHLGLQSAVVYGGVGQASQVRALSRGLDILVATPGRLLDLMGQRHARLEAVETLVLDEADRMLDMGFIHDVTRIIAALPARRQTLLFSATMPSDIAALADRILSDPVRVAVTPVASTVETVEQRVLHVARGDKRPLLDMLLKDGGIRRALIFTRTKHGADKVATQLARSGVSANAIHGNKSQGARERALADFRAGRTRVLVATDIAARGIDIDGVTHVINYDLPNIPESYVHRIGRTARAGTSGVAMSFCDHEERAYLRDIEKLIRQAIPVMDHAHRLAMPAPAAEPARRQRPELRRQRVRRRRR
ncbi:MAG: DEAD/DEAH box helicase [Alphaproteobacteria bacterium]|nr:DEAD/DEAH box helicase [Alphaproteobacteria bacterium]